MFFLSGFCKRNKQTVGRHEDVFEKKDLAAMIGACSVLC
jgi:hypothetical protein